MLAVGDDVDRGVGGAYFELGLEEQLGDAGLEGVFFGGVGDGEKAGVVDEKKLVAVFGPARLGAAVRGDLPLAARAGEGDNVNLRGAGVRGAEGDPAAVRRKLRVREAHGGDASIVAETLRGCGLAVIAETHSPHIAAAATLLRGAHKGQHFAVRGPGGRVGSERIVGRELLFGAGAIGAHAVDAFAHAGALAAGVGIGEVLAVGRPDGKIGGAGLESDGRGGAADHVVNPDAADRPLEGNFFAVRRDARRGGVRRAFDEHGAVALTIEKNNVEILFGSGAGHVEGGAIVRHGELHAAVGNVRVYAVQHGDGGAGEGEGFGVKGGDEAGALGEIDEVAAGKVAAEGGVLNEDLGVARG